MTPQHCQTHDGRADDRRRAPRGFTLVEMLAVIVIMSILASLVLAMARPALEKRRMREAARIVTTMLAQARSRATESGRPYGVWIERLPGTPNSAMDIFFAYVPPPYAGSSWDSRAMVSGPGQCQFSEAINPFLISAGDEIKFGIQGQHFRVVSAQGQSCQFEPIEGALPTNPGAQQAVPYQVFRKPRRAPAGGVSLPAPTVIDLDVSSIGVDGTRTLAGTGRILIMFSPQGSIHSIDVGDGVLRRPAEPVFLMVGRNEKVGLMDPDGSGEKANIADFYNLWIAVGFQSGNVTVAENVGTTGGVNPRQFARAGSSMRGS